MLDHTSINSHKNCSLFKLRGIRDRDIHKPFFASEHRRRGRKTGGRFSPEREHRRRVSRGDIKYILLSLLAEKPQHGYQLIKEIENRWGGFYRPSPGSVYPTLQQLEERNYLTSQEVEGKKVYSITDSGEQLLAQQPSSAETLNKSEEQPKLIELKMTLRDLQEVIMQVTRSDKSKNIDKVLSSLKKLKKEIYLMLANEED
ncbi:Transcriptional regulator, PadR family [Crocosphaera watsonii WH 8502]|uniref:Transcription regulator PadR N-terminal domain-containing protein n=2 Tax=Crocosphaera watsonii TaxID=263511 RepID=G5J5M9_CROWT|nr:hypothetical protein CWATWH0003_2784 [Crocosphaera watsonii WH 0003]NQZ63026.1 helix-turn-helix transcriptional regulator [Crocosphaera sp.]CCQ51674.1 Transcriptional regulator, PadR family [Crocosphaera watsonii WH 8502]